MNRLSNKSKLIIMIVCVALLIASVVGWIVTNNYVTNMTDKQTVKYANFWGIKNWFDEPIDESWATVVQSGIQSYRKSGDMLLSSGMDSRAMAQSIEHSLQVIDGVFIAAICLFAAGAVCCIVLITIKRTNKARPVNGERATV